MPAGHHAGMAYALHDGEPDRVRRLTFVPFLPSGDCAAVPDPDGRVYLPAGEVRAGEDWLLEASLRIPLAVAGYRPQRVRAFAADGDHVYAWLDGDRYRGHRRHADIDLVTGDAAEIAARLADAGRPTEARAVRDGAYSFRTESDDDYYAGVVRLLEPAYLRGTTPQHGSGFSGDAARWRERRGMIGDGIDRSGTFLDLGCANGLLMESVRQWAAERGHDIEPYGVDLAPGLVALARARLPHWADRLTVGNAIDYRPADGRRFTFVHTLLDLVPVRRRPDLVRHALDALVAPGGRLLVSHYQGDGGTDRSAAAHLCALGFPVAGSASQAGGAATTAWVDAPPG